MQNIIPVDFIDVSNMAAALMLRHRTHFTSSHPWATAHTRVIPLRGEPDIVHGDEPAEFEEVFEDIAFTPDWPTWHTVRDAIAASHLMRAARKPDFGFIFVESLESGGWADWQRSAGAYATRFDRFRICLVPSPGAWTYSGGEGMILPMGQLTYVDQRAPHAALNVGPVAVIHLVVDIRRPEQADGAGKPN